MSRPDGHDLRALEDQARRRGSGLADPPEQVLVAGAAHRLSGTWVLEQLWKPGVDRPTAWTAALLNSFGACLEIGERGSNERFGLRNGLALGLWRLDFHGSAWLVGRRPLLVFGFDRLTLRFGRTLLLQRALPQLARTAPSLRRSRQQPFFALIACDREQGWLAARGRGGGLALWGLKELPDDQERLA